MTLWLDVMFKSSLPLRLCWVFGSEDVSMRRHLTVCADSSCGSEVRSERRISADTANSRRSYPLARGLQRCAAAICSPARRLWNILGIWKYLPFLRNCVRSGDIGALPASQTSDYTVCIHDWFLPQSCDLQHGSVFPVRSQKSSGTLCTGRSSWEQVMLEMTFSGYWSLVSFLCGLSGCGSQGPPWFRT